MFPDVSLSFSSWISNKDFSGPLLSQKINDCVLAKNRFGIKQKKFKQIFPK